MRFGSESDLFAIKRDESFKGSIGAIYQTFDGIEVYPSLEEKDTMVKLVEFKISLYVRKIDYIL